MRAISAGFSSTLGMSPQQLRAHHLSVSDKNTPPRLGHSSRRQLSYTDRAAVLGSDVFPLAHTGHQLAQTAYPGAQIRSVSAISQPVGELGPEAGIVPPRHEFRASPMG